MRSAESRVASIQTSGIWFPHPPDNHDEWQLSDIPIPFRESSIFLSPSESIPYRKRERILGGVVAASIRKVLLFHGNRHRWMYWMHMF